MAGNQRVVYGILALGFAKIGENVYIPAHGVQSATINTNFNIEDVFELSQSAVYQIIEEVPDVQLSATKVLDGYPLLSHLLTNGATTGTLQGRQNIRSIVAMDIFMDTQDNASGTPIVQINCSGVYWNGSTFTFPVDGNATEEITAVGNNKVIINTGFTFAGAALNSVFNGNDAPAYGSVMRRQHFDFNNGNTRLPKCLPGISSSGTNDANNEGFYPCSIQNCSVSFDFGREDIRELGHKGPYFKFPRPNIDVTTTIDVVSKSGDTTTVYADADNLTNETIIIKTLDSTRINLGAKNKLQGITMNGGDTGGGYQTLQYTFLGKNVATISHSADPSGL